MPLSLSLASVGQEAWEGRDIIGASEADLPAVVQTPSNSLNFPGEGDEAGIFFGEGQYAPDTEAGRFLLAHEMVHVLQQRATSSHVPTQLEGTGAIQASYHGAKPGIDYRDGRFAVLHLSRNKGGIIHQSARTAVDISAIRLTGTVSMRVDKGDAIGDFWAGFHFIQLFYSILDRATYAGQTESDGSMFLDFAHKSNYAGYQQWVIDSDPDNGNLIPYAEQYTGLNQLGPFPDLYQAKVILDDHPFSEYPLMFPNDAGRKQLNFLYKVERHFSVLTTLVAIEKSSGATKPLISVGWGAQCTARVPWSVANNKNPTPSAAIIESSYFNVGEPKQGVPSENGTAKLLEHPPSNPSDMYNAMKKAAQRTVGSAAVNTFGVQAQAKR